MIQLGEHFGDDWRHGNSEAARRRQWFIKARQDKAQRELLADEAEASSLTAATAIVMATEAQIAAFETRLDAYEARLDAYEAKLDARDEAITKALIANAEKYDALMELREKLLDNAYELPDGRKVFKSENGKTVHFEDGSLVPDDIVRPDDIPNGFTSHEAMKQNGLDLDSVKRERDALHDAQAENDRRHDALDQARDKIGNARDQIEQGGLTAEDIDDLDQDILDNLPPDDFEPLPVSAAKFLAEGDTTNSATNLKSSFDIPANPVAAMNTNAPSVREIGFEPNG